MAASIEAFATSGLNESGPTNTVQMEARATLKTATMTERELQTERAQLKDLYYGSEPDRAKATRHSEHLEELEVNGMAMIKMKKPESRGR